MADVRHGLSVVDRAMIEMRLGEGFGLRAIARALGRSVGTVSGEIGRNGGRAGYSADAALARSVCVRRRSGRQRRLMPGSVLFAQVAGLLRLGWSPEQIAGRRKRIEDDVELHSGLLVSHETIYTALYALPRGELRRELIACLRQDKPWRGRKPKDGERRGKLCDMTSIRDRPEDVEGRLVPGHWEGDLILGSANSAVGTLVERSTRFLLLVLMPTHKAVATAGAFAGAQRHPADPAPDAHL